MPYFRSCQLALLFSFCYLPQLALAETGFYLGAEAGYSDISLKDLDDDQSFHGYVGYKVIDIVGLELGYGDLGEFANARTGASSSISVESVMQASVAFHAPLLTFDTGAIHVRYGYYQADLVANSPNGNTPSKDGRGFTYGLGISYPIVKPISVGVSWQYYGDVDEQSINTYSAGLRLDF